MKYQRILYYLSVFMIVSAGLAALLSTSAGAEEWTESYEAFKPADDPAYHQRHTGNVEWHLFHDAADSDTKSDKPKYTDIYWIEGGNAFQKRINDVKGTSRLHHMVPANVDSSKNHSPCPLCNFPTYFWLDASVVDADTEKHIKADYSKWDKSEGLCRNCFECYQLRAGKFYEGNAATTTDEYVIGYMKSDSIRDYFKNVK